MTEGNLIEGEAWLVVHPMGDRGRLSATRASDFAARGDIVAGDRVRASADEAAEACRALARRHGLIAELDPRLTRLQAGYAPDDLFWLAIFPEGDLERISVAQAQWFDVADYRLASTEFFPDEEAAWTAAISIARRWGIAVDGRGPRP